MTVRLTGSLDGPSNGTCGLDGCLGDDVIAVILTISDVVGTTVLGGTIDGFPPFNDV